MSNVITRRKLLQAGAAASASVLIGPAAMARTYSANEKIRFALVGVGGMGGKGVNVASGEQIVAAADVDRQPRRRLDQEHQGPLPRCENL